MSSQEEARKSRAKSRARRKKGATPEPADGQEQPDESGSPEGEHPSSVKQAAKVAAVGAAVGAATAAARALTHDRDAPGDGSEREEAPTDADDEGVSETVDGEPEPPPEAQGDGPESSAESRPGEREPRENRDQSEPVAGAAPDEVSTAVRQGREQLQALLGRDVEAVSGLERTRDGWRIKFEVVEFARVPESTDVMASYEVDLDEGCGLRSYARVGRYTRAQANSGEQQ